MDVKLNLFTWKNANSSLILITILIIPFLISYVSAADPQGPDVVNSINNSTKGNVTAYMFNISGGNISKLTVSAVLQNDRWKAFVGNVTGSLTLDDAASKTIYDWSLSSITGKVYATRNSSTPSWTNINCTDNTTLRRQQLENENTNLEHSNPDDNITATFDNFTHPSFYAASNLVQANVCPVARPYINDTAQGTSFNVTILYDNLNLIFAAHLEDDEYGYNGDTTNRTYDFQMIVPENGNASWTSATAYYLYVQLD